MAGGPHFGSAFPSVLQRYFQTHLVGNDDQVVHVHHNGIAILAVHKTHPLLNKKITNLTFRSDDAKNLYQNNVTGKNKTGATFLQPRDRICSVKTSDGAETDLYACVRAYVIEINQRLVEQPQMLGHSSGIGWIAILKPQRLGETGEWIQNSRLEFGGVIKAHDDGTSRSARKKRMRREQICYSFREQGTCRFGDNCRFSHVALTTTSPPPSKNSRLSNDGNRRSTSE